MSVRLSLREHGATPGSIESVRDRIAAAFRHQYPNPLFDVPYSAWAYIVGTYPDEGYVIVCWDTPAGEAFARYDFTASGESFAFGPAQPLEVQYVPVAAVEEAARLRALEAAADRRWAGSLTPLREAKFDQARSTLDVVVIEAGFNVARSRFYTEAALQGAPAVFAGLKMYANHQTAAEQKARPEGDLGQWVANLVEASYDATGHVVRGIAKIIDPAWLEKVNLLNEQGQLHTLGLSIRAVGSGEEDTIESFRTFRVDEFAAGISVDFVTEAGAGGRAVALVESASDDDVALLTIQRLRERRPDLVAALVSEASKPKEAQVTPEQIAALQRRAEEAERERDAARSATAAAESALQTERATTAAREAQAAVAAAIAEAGLPEASTKLLSGKTFASLDEANAAIAEQRTLIEGLGVKPVVKPNPVRGLGESAPGAPVAATASLEEAFKGIPGMSEAAAKVAAGGRV